jgi:hypothetical protein
VLIVLILPLRMVYWFADGWDGAGEGAQAGANQDPDEPGEGPRRGEFRSDW